MNEHRLAVAAEAGDRAAQAELLRQCARRGDVDRALPLLRALHLGAWTVARFGGAGVTLAEMVRAGRLLTRLPLVEPVALALPLSSRAAVLWACDCTELAHKIGRRQYDEEPHPDAVAAVAAAQAWARGEATVAAVQRASWVASRAAVNPLSWHTVGLRASAAVFAAIDYAPDAVHASQAAMSAEPFFRRDDVVTYQAERLWRRLLGVDL